MKAETLRALLARPGCHVMPCCFDALSAKLIEQEGFGVTFMSGFALSAARIGQPDLGLMSYGEVAQAVGEITAATSLPLIADGDTGYGNAMNVRRTIAGLARAGAACVMIEDQLAPKRCGHVAGKAVVDRDEALDRIRAACDERDALAATGTDVLILARTDARHEHGLGEAMARAEAFAEIGADILFVEAPRNEAEMREVGGAFGKPHMANLVDGGLTPDIPVDELGEMGFGLAAYPLTLLGAAMQAMIGSLRAMKGGQAERGAMDFRDLKARVGFDDYEAAASAYSSGMRAP